MRSSSSYKSKFSLLFLFAVNALIPLSAVAATHEVMVLDNSFSPSVLTIEVGDTVRWINAAGGNPHDVTANDSSWASVTASSFTYERVFDTIGEFPYYCTVHSTPGGTRMNGTINVVDSAAATADISIESFNVVDGAYAAGAECMVMATLKNTSDEDSGTFSVNFYASADSDITTGDTLLGAKSITNIAAGASSNINESVELPDSLAAGDYFIGAISDLADTDPSNDSNVDETSIYVFTEFEINAGLNDAWFNPLTDGQGFFITVFPDLGFVSLAWFTYDTELPPEDATANLGDPGHRWLTALGAIDGDMTEMDISITSGGIFDTPPDDGFSRVADGTIILQFNNCNEGTISYDIPSIDADGVVPIRRVAIDNVALCNALLRESQQTP